MKIQKKEDKEKRWEKTELILMLNNFRFKWGNNLCAGIRDSKKPLKFFSGFF